MIHLWHKMQKAVRTSAAAVVNIVGRQMSAAVVMYFTGTFSCKGKQSIPSCSAAVVAGSDPTQPGPGAVGWQQSATDTHVSVHQQSHIENIVPKAKAKTTTMQHTKASATKNKHPTKPKAKANTQTSIMMSPFVNSLREAHQH